MRCRPAVIIACAVTAMWCPAPAAAQSSAAAPVRSSPDFLFGRPRLSVSVRGGWVMARAGSDWYDFVRNELTLDRGDFNTPAFASDVTFAVTPRIAIAAGVEYGEKGVLSEYRDFVDQDRRSIDQETRLHQVNLSGTVRLALRDRGREISTLAWIPSRVVPYVGAGGGLMRYRLQQTGDFVDFVDFSVFSDVFRSAGWTPTAVALAGVDFKVLPRLYTTFEGRYLWAADDLESSWVGFNPLDLSGLRVSAGISVLF